MGGSQPAAAAVSGSSTLRAAGPAPSPCADTTAPGQSPVASSQTQRPQQGQVKLTMAQLMQLTQGAQVRDAIVISFLLVFFFVTLFSGLS